MAIFSRVVGFITTLIVLIFVLQMIASERVEVVELHTFNQQGEETTTRLWVVDFGGYQYLRVGADGSGWFSRIQSNQEFEITRNGRRYRYTAVVRQELGAKINELMRVKYGWSDSLIGMLVGSREGSIPIELNLVN